MKNLLFFFIILSSLCFSCEKMEFNNEDCYIFGDEFPISVNGVSSMILGDKTIIMTQFVAVDGCDRNGYYQVFQNTETEFTLNLKTKVDGCTFCTQAITIQTAYYLFEPTKKGENKLNFIMANDSVFTHTITVM